MAVTTEADPESLATVGRTHADVLRLMTEMSAAYEARRAAVVAARVDGHSLQAIANEIGVSRGRIAQLANIEKKRKDRRAAKRTARDRARAQRVAA